MLVSLFLVRGLCAFMRDERGVDDVFLRETGLTREQLEQSHGFVDGSALVRAAAAAYQISADAALGLHLGSSVPPQTLRAVSQLFVQCPTLRAAVGELQRYMPLIASRGGFKLEEEGEVARFVFEPEMPGDWELRFIVEFAFAWSQTVARQFVGERTCPIEVRLPYPAPAYAAEYEAVFRCPASFDAERAEIVFDRRYLDARQPWADQHLYKVLKDEAESLLRAQLPNEPMYSRVRAIFRQEELALGEGGRKLLLERLGISERSLRRRLSQEGQTLGAVMDEVRKEQAFQLLAQTDTPVKQISARIGFSEPSAFYRAFRRWTGGLTPVDYRLERQGGRTRVA
jgi:AraC-like DNA-binding protein